MLKSYIHSSWIVLSVCPLALWAKKNNPQKPNVIVIMADDLGYGDIACYGATRVKTPFVDALAERGIKFTNAHAVAATSTPSRYAFLTGEYPFRKPNTDVAAGNAGMIIRPVQFTAADLFRSKGYTTAAIGKWHLGVGDRTGEQDWNAPLPCGPNDLGFDYSYIMAATADRVPCVFLENGVVSNYDATASIEVSYSANFAGEPTGKTHPELLYNLKPSHGHDMSIVNGISRIGYMKGGGKALWKDEDIADSIVSHAEDFIRQNRDNPFFMYLCTNDIHVPRFPHERFRGKSAMGLRGDAILQFDWTVGRITQLLKKLKIDENTLIILTSDNGPVLDDGYQDRAEELVGDHKAAGPLRGGKYSSFEAGTTVPFIVSWPRMVKPGVSHALISQIDFMGSMAKLAGVRIPLGMAPDSYNQLAGWIGIDTQGRSWALEYAANRTLSVRTQKWKFIEPNAGPKVINWGPKIETGCSNEPQLYDMKDAYETENLAGQHPHWVERFTQLIQRERAPKTSDVIHRNTVPSL